MRCPVLSQGGLTVVQWVGRICSPVGWPGGAGAPGVGVWLVIIVANVRWMSWMALERAALVATRLSMVVFFWMDVLARLSSDVGGHLLRLFDLPGLVGAEGGFAGCHAGDVAHFGKCSCPVYLTARPCVLYCWLALPFSPAERHVAAGKRMFGAGSDHQFVGDWDSRIGGEDLTLLLFLSVEGQGEAKVMPVLNLVMLSSRSGWLIWMYVVRICWTSVQRSTLLSSSVGLSRTA